MTSEEHKKMLEEFNDFSNRVADLKTQNEAYAQENLELEKRTSHINQDLVKAVERLDFLKKEITKAEEDLKRKQIEGANCDAQKREIQQQLSQAQIELKQAIDNVEELRKETTRLSNERQRLEQDMKEKAETIEVRYLSLKDWKEQLEIKEAQIKRREELMAARIDAGLIKADV